MPTEQVRPRMLKKRPPASQPPAQTGVVKPQQNSFANKNTSSGLRPFILTIHGVGGVGKTSFASFAPDPLFIIDRQETGILDLQHYGLSPQCPVKVIGSDGQPWLGVLEALDDVVSSPNKTIVLDSATGIEKYCFQHVCKRDYENNWAKDGFYSYQQGPKKAAKQEWPDFLDKLQDLKELGKNVILIAHSQSKAHNNPEGPDYDRWIPYLDKETWSITYRWSETALFANFHVDLEKSKQSPRFKSKGEAKRFMHTEWSPSFDAKNRWNLPPVISMGSSGEEAWANFVKHLK